MRLVYEKSQICSNSEHIRQKNFKKNLTKNFKRINLLVTLTTSVNSIQFFFFIMLFGQSSDKNSSL